MSHGPSPTGASQSVDVLKKALIVAVLVGGVVLLHHFAAGDAGADPRGLMALGFVILTAYTVGELAEVLRLPHITGYLLAGLLLGPSVAHELGALLPAHTLPPPFDQGVLSEGVISQLSLLDTRALPLIALAAGGELHIRELKEGLKPILSVLFGQMVTLTLAFMALALVLGGLIPGIGLPMISALSIGGQLSIGAVLGALGLATSAAATIAVILGAGAKGPMTRTILSVVVLKDVAVVVMFATATAIASATLGVGGGDGLGASMVHILLSIVLGAVVGGLVHLYLRFINAERLLFLVALIYTTAFVCTAIQAEVALVFIMAGFVVANFSDQGEVLIRDVERLSLPVFVVFFTLAGARLHVDVIVRMAGYAALLITVRGLATWAGVAVGGKLGGADANTRKYGWMGMIAQAGLAISLAGKLPSLFPGGLGDELFALVLAGVAAHEVIGPGMLQVALGKAGEVPGGAEEAQTKGVVVVPGAPEPVVEDEAGWGPTLDSDSVELNQAVRELEEDLKRLVLVHGQGVPAAWQAGLQTWLANVRREFVRVHRRASVVARDPQADPLALAALLRDLEESWRVLVLRRSAEDPLVGWDSAGLVAQLDLRLDGVPLTVVAAVSDDVLARRDEPMWKATARAWLRLHRRVGGRPRELAMRSLVRFHLGGRAVGRLEGVIAPPAGLEFHVATGLGRLIAELAQAWPTEGGPEAVAGLDTLKQLVGDRIGGLHDEAEAAVGESAGRLEAILATGMRDIKTDTVVLGTVDLPRWTRRFSLVYGERNEGMEALTLGLARVREGLGARMRGLSVELEVAGVEASAAAAATHHAEAISRHMLDLGVKPHQTLQERAKGALEAVGLAVQDEALSGAELGATLQGHADTMGSAVRDLRERLSTLEGSLSEVVTEGLQDDLLEEVGGLTDRVEVPARDAIPGGWALPQVASTVSLPLRETAQGWVEARIGGELLTALRRTIAHVEVSLSAALELERVLAFNTELAASELEVFGERHPPQDVRDIVGETILGAVGRSLVRVSDAGLTLADVQQSFGGELRAIAVSGLRELREELVSGRLSSLRRLARTEAAVRRGLARQASALFQPLPTLLRRGDEVLLGILGQERSRALHGWWSGQALLPPTVEELQPPEPSACLPIVYQRLFTDLVVSNTSLVGDRAAQVAAAVATLKRPRGVRAAVVIGEDAASRAMLTTELLRSLPGAALRVGADDLARGLPTGTDTVVVSDLAELVGMGPGGLAAADRLAGMLIAERGRRVWVLEVAPETWGLLVDHSALGRAVPTVLNPGPLSQDELKEAILGRHAMSGYSLDFDVRELRGMRLADVLVQTGDRQRHHREVWFRHLRQQCGGSLSLGLRLWMSAVREVDEKDGVLRVGPVAPTALRALTALDDGSLILMRQGLIFGRLDPVRLSQVQGLDLLTSRAELAALEARGLLVSVAPDRWTVPMHLCRPLREALIGRGWAA